MRNYTSQSTDTDVCFTLTFASDILEKLLSKKDPEPNITYFEKVFKLTSKINISNMVLYYNDNKLYKYNNPLDILKDYYKVRIDCYHKKKKKPN